MIDRLLQEGNAINPKKMVAGGTVGSVGGTRMRDLQRVPNQIPVVHHVLYMLKNQCHTFGTTKTPRSSKSHKSRDPICIYIYTHRSGHFGGHLGALRALGIPSGKLT